MALHRFFVAPEALAAGRVTLPPEHARQVARVLRLRPSDEIVVLDDSGMEHLARLERVQPDGVQGVVVERRPNRAEPALRLTLYQALLPRERFEWVLQKGTEVGVARFVPLETRRSLPGRETTSRERLTRWRQIVREAAEQSGRGRLPVVDAAQTLAAALDEMRRVGPALLAWEQEGQLGLRAALAALPPDGAASLVVGPEGGFAAPEVAAARAAGVTPVSLGPRILRAETAGPLLAALALFATGNMEAPAWTGR